MALAARRVSLDSAHAPWTHLALPSEPTEPPRAGAPREEEAKHQETPPSRGGVLLRRISHSRTQSLAAPTSSSDWSRLQAACMAREGYLGSPARTSSFGTGSCSSPQWVDPNALEIDLSKSARIQRRRSSSRDETCNSPAQMRQQRAQRSQRLHLLLDEIASARSSPGSQSHRVLLNDISSSHSSPSHLPTTVPLGTAQCPGHLYQAVRVAGCE